MSRTMLAGLAVLLTSHPAAAQKGGPDFGDRLRWGNYHGTVTAVSHWSIAIDGDGEGPANGRVARFRGVREFPVSPLLRRGGFPTDEYAGHCYRLKDLRIGDEVVVWYRAEGEANTVAYIGITRRPFGRVPPSPAEPPDSHSPYHFRTNRYNETRALIEPALAKVPRRILFRLAQEDATREREDEEREVAEGHARARTLLTVVETYNHFPDALRPGLGRLPWVVDGRAWPTEEDNNRFWTGISPYGLVDIPPPQPTVLDVDAHLKEAQARIERARAAYRKETGKELDVPDVYRPVAPAPPPRPVTRSATLIKG